MNVTPLKDRLIVKLDTGTTRTAAGLYVSRQVHAPGLETGKVLAVAPDEPRVKVGDRVIFAHGAGQDHTIDNQEVVGLRREQLLGILV